MFTLNLPARDMLIARIQVYAWANIVYGDFPKAQADARETLRAFDYMMEVNPAHEAGYWAMHYFERFCDSWPARA